MCEPLNLMTLFISKMKYKTTLLFNVNDFILNPIYNTFFDKKKMYQE